MCAYRVVPRLARQKLFGLAAVRAVADWIRRVIAAVIRMNNLGAPIRDFKTQHAADTGTDRDERIISRVTDNQRRISPQIKFRWRPKRIAPREHTRRPNLLAERLGRFHGNQDSSSENHQGDKQYYSIFHRIPPLR